MNTNINKITARYILDSRANPTVEVDITLEDGSLDVQQFLQSFQPENLKLMN